MARLLPMKLAVAQIQPVSGSIRTNVDRHLKLIELSLHHDADLLVFPELSLTGYEPTQASEWALAAEDPRFHRFQEIADHQSMIVTVGFPLRTNDQSSLPRISAQIFRPNSTPRIYSKQFLHDDEKPYFECGADSVMIHSDPAVALAICYELSVAEHERRAFDAGATAYVASVAKHECGVRDAYVRLSEIAKRNSALVMLSNCLGIHDGVMCVGQSAVWDRQGNLLAQLDSENEGVIIVDFDTEAVETDTMDTLS